MPLHLLQILNSPWDWNIAFCTMCFSASLVFHSFDSSTFGATRDIISQYSFTRTLVGLNKGGNEREPPVTSSSNVLMGGESLAC